MSKLFKKEYVSYGLVLLGGLLMSSIAAYATTTISTNVATGGSLSASSTVATSDNYTVTNGYGLDTSSSGGTLNIGTTTATAINIGSPTAAVTFRGNVKYTAGYGLDLSANGILNIGTTTATTIQIGNTNATTKILGLLTIPVNYSIDAASTGSIGIGTTTATTIVVGNSSAKVGVATTSPFATFSVQGAAGTIPFAVSTSTVASGGPAFEVDTNGHILTRGGLPYFAATSCGTSPTVTGNDAAGVITTGTGAPTSCTITFANAYPNAPACAVTSGINASTLISAVYATTTTTKLNFMATSSGSVGAGMTSWTVSYICIGTL